MDKSKYVHGDNLTTVKTPNRHMKRLLHIGDTILSLFVISPLVVAHW